LSLEPQLNATLIPAYLRGGEAVPTAGAAGSSSETAEASTSNSGPV
ncbi:hypothetical protein MRX96_022662, partial [Rhipicephalus microplus]